jgi:alkanesulfonate monooxygenase SsuD/methylene tetrahydromethanopterin reductase-like flavin-dependent oxidoreductase (luciferase family)
LEGFVASPSLGLVLVTGETRAAGTARWTELRELALLAEQMGLDRVWVIDELLWRTPDRPPLGFWDGVAMAGAVAAATSRIQVGTWILSALHRNPGITAKAVETLDEISGGRFIFGLGAGHAWPGQARAFGLPEDHIHARFEEALEIIVPLLRGGHADFEGTYHAARDLEHRPVGPRPGRIPLMIGAHGPKMLRLAASHADVWSTYAEERNDLAEFGPRLTAFDVACAEVGRDPGTVGRSAGITIAADGAVTGDELGGSALRGSPQAIATALRAFGDAGYTQVEFMIEPQTIEALQALAPAIGLVQARRPA